MASLVEQINGVVITRLAPARASKEAPELLSNGMTRTSPQTLPRIRILTVQKPFSSFKEGGRQQAITRPVCSSEACLSVTCNQTFQIQGATYVYTLPPSCLHHELPAHSLHLRFEAANTPPSILEFSNLVPSLHLSLGGSSSVVDREVPPSSAPTLPLPPTQKGDSAGEPEP